LYIIGGFNGHERLRSVETLDLLQPDASWEFASELRIARSNFGVTIVDGKILVSGGFDGTTVVCETELFSEKTNCWTLSNPMNVRRSALCLVTVKDLPNRMDYLEERKA
jgi:hypothetical protein